MTYFAPEATVVTMEIVHSLCEGAVQRRRCCVWDNGGGARRLVFYCRDGNHPVGLSGRLLHDGEEYYDRIITTADTSRKQANHLLTFLRSGGVMVAPVIQAGGSVLERHLKRSRGEAVVSLHGAVRFVPFK
jgi:protein-L-isoaspartate O-methyltransferase